MASSATPPELTELLTQTRWVRALAGNLVGDSHAADDLAQDACLAALDRPPERADNLRAWLRTVMQNLVRQQSRAATRRQRREEVRQVDRDDLGEAADDLVARAQIQRAVVDAVLSLSPLLRDTVLLRYFEQLMPRAIARRMAVPVATVHSRLQRAHAQLRQSLDRGFGAGCDWRAALLPLPFAVPAVVPPVVLLAMNMKVASVVAAVAIGSAVFWFGVRTDTNTDNPESASAPPVVAETAIGFPATPAAGQDGATERVAATPPPAIAEPAPSVAMRQCSGRVVDAEGRSVNGIEVQVAEARVTTDSAGAFEAATVAQQSFAVRSADSAWQTVLEGAVRAGEDPPPVLLVVAPSIRLAGHVRSSRGDAMAATVRVVLPSDLRTRLSHISDAASETPITAKAGTDGAFELGAAAVRGAELLVMSEGCVPHRRPLPMADDLDLTIVLERLEGVAGSLQGQVVDPHGRAVAGAHIGLGGALARSDEQGNFVITDDGEAASLCASAKGLRRGVLERGVAGFPPFVVLTLGATPLSIRGKVVDETGKGLAGIAVWPNDPTVLGASRSPMPVEGIAAGCMTTAELRERFQRGDFAGQQPAQVMRENPTVMWPFVMTGSDGAFDLGGLEDRPYRLRAMDNETLLMTEQDAVPAGSVGVRLVLDQSHLFEKVTGVVVSRDGTPIPGASIVVQIDTQSISGSTMHGRAVASDTTDEEGRFELARVPKQRAYFRIDGDNILPSEPGRNQAGGIWELAGGRPHELRIEVRVRMHVQIELLDPGRADTITVLDDRGEPLMIDVFEGQRRRSSDDLALADGRSPVFVVPDSARTLVLSKNGAEVGREALQLRAGDVNTLRF